MSRRPASSKYDAARLKYLETEKLFGNLSTEGGIFEIVLASPQGYGPAMSSLRFQNFFRQLASWPETSCERAFYPSADEYHWRSRYGHPAVTLETGKSIRKSDLLAFSLSDESEYLKVLQMMELAGMELRSEKRTDKWPLVIVSGIPVTANPLRAIDSRDPRHGQQYYASMGWLRWHGKSLLCHFPRVCIRCSPNG